MMRIGNSTAKEITEYAKEAASTSSWSARRGEAPSTEC